MSLEIINPYTIRIIIACRKRDSIRAISQRIGVSYGWTYKWVQELAKLGVFDIVRTKISLNEKEEFYKKMIKVIKEMFGESPPFYYEVLSLLGIEYYFSESDAVYVWTKGGYNIGRYKENYPIFIKVKKKDREVFEWYCEKLDLKKDKKGGVFYKLKYEENLKFEDCEGIPVQSFKETIKFMKKNKYNFEPALEMVKELYNKKIKAKYKEVIVNV